MNRFFALAGLSFVVAASAQAAVVNGSFEEPFLTSGFSNQSLPGWSRTATDIGVWVLPSSGFFNAPAPDGRQILYGNSGSIAQQLTDAVVEGDNIASFYAARRSDSFAGSFRFDMYAGGTVANGAVTGGTLIGSYTFDHTTVAPTTFTYVEVNYTALAGDALIGQQVSLKFTQTTGQMNLDDVRFNTDPVPEPATLALLALAPLALKSRRKN